MLTGGLIAVLAVLLWTFSAIIFELVARRGGSSLNINLVKCIIATLFLSISLWIVSGKGYPIGVDMKTLFWLSLSGLTGFAICDVAMVNAYKMITARYTQVVMTLGPIVAATLSYIFLNETLGIFSLLGMMLTLFGIVICIISRQDEKGQSKIHLRISKQGFILALIAAIGQGSGLALSKVGMKFYKESLSIDTLRESSFYIPLSATMIRIVTCVIVLFIIVLLRREFKGFLKFWSIRKLIVPTSLAAFFATFLGVVFSLMALTYASAAVVSTILATIPILIIIPDYFIYRRKVSVIQLLGSVISVAGIAVMFLFQ